MKCKLIKGQTPYTADGCATSSVFAVNTHLNGNKSGDTIADIAYRKELSNYVLNCGEGPGSFSNIMRLHPATIVKVKAKEFYQRFMSEININVFAAQAVTSTVGGTATLVISQASHLNTGTASMLNQGYTLVNQRNGQVYAIEGVPSKAVNYAHSAVVRAYGNEAVVIKVGDPLAVFATRIIGDVACSTLPSITLRDMGYTSVTSPLRFETSWCMEHGIEIQNEVYQLAMMDNEGNEFTTWDPVVRSNKRREVEIARTLYFFFGTKITNPNITVQGNFKGWNGYLYTMKYGGGNYQEIPMTGITIREMDMIETQAVKFGIKEFTWYLPHEQRNNLETNLNLLFANSAGSCSFETFRRAGGTDEERSGGLVTQLGVTSFKRNGITHHFMTADWATETNGLGNGILRDAIFVIPSVGSKDIQGNEVPTFEMLEFDENLGMHHYRYEETYDDLSKRGPDFCEKSMGVIRETMWWKINCLTNHWQFQPSGNC
jgi:hypothetical protein